MDNKPTPTSEASKIQADADRNEGPPPPTAENGANAWRPKTGSKSTDVTANPTDRECPGLDVSAIAEPIRMYTAHAAAAPRANKKPVRTESDARFSPSPPISATPTKARSAATPVCLVRPRKTATATGPTNSIETAVPRGSRAMAS